MQDEFDRQFEENQVKVRELEQEMSTKIQESKESKLHVEALQLELSELKNEIIDVTDTKNKLIEEAQKKIDILESDLKNLSEVDAEKDPSAEVLQIKADYEAQRLKIIELTSQIEQSKEQKMSSDMHLTTINEALENVKLQLSEREAEIAQLEDVIKQREEEEVKEKAVSYQICVYRILLNDTDLQVLFTFL